MRSSTRELPAQLVVGQTGAYVAPWLGVAIAGVGDHGFMSCNRLEPFGQVHSDRNLEDSKVKILEPYAQGRCI